MASPERADTDALLRAIVESSDDAIVSKDLDGYVTSWNQAAERMFGYTAEEIIGRSIRTIIPSDRQDEEDRVLASVRRGEKVEHFETIRQAKNGDLVPISLTVSPVFTSAGRLVGASKVARDISDRVRAEKAAAAERERDGLLAQVTAVLSESLDSTRTLRAIADVAVPRFADWCAVDVVREDGSLSRVVKAHADPGLLESMDRAHAQRSGAPAAGSPMHVVRTGKPYLVSAVTDEVLVSAANGDEEQLAFLRGLGYSSYICVPMLLRGRCLGAITFTATVSGRHYDSEDLRFCQEIASRVGLAVENARAYEEVQSANRLKDEFLATLSHEMRTPLNAVLGYSRMLRSGVIAADRRQQALEVIERNAASLTQIVEDVLDVSRIISGKARLQMQPVELSKVIENAVATVMPAAEAKGVQLDAPVDETVGPVAGDPDRLQQVVWNLLSNAVKFTPRGGRVEARLDATAATVDIVVSDTGIGISPEFLPHIFERFRQAEGGTTRRHGGLGLGLAIARHIVEMHGGTIQASSGGPGTGSTFRVQLPVMIGRESGATAPQAAGANDTMLPQERATLSGVTVLAVDDDNDARALLELILERAGATVTVVGSAAEALARLPVVRPSVLVADLAMPGEDGYSLIERVRQLPDPVLRATPAAALTAYARPEDRARSLRSGFAVHLAKPLDPAEVVAAVASLAGRGL